MHRDAQAVNSLRALVRTPQVHQALEQGNDTALCFVLRAVLAERLLTIPAEPSPELRIPAPQLKREWSPWPEFSSDPGNPRELSKG